MDQTPDGGAPTGTSTRPYLIRALHDWCTDNGFTPYIAVQVDRSVQVPLEYVSNNEIVLNVGFDATNGLDLGNEFIQFKARFGGVAREIIVPVDHVVAIYARENGQGMAFPAPAVEADPASAVKSAPQAAPKSAPKLAPKGLRLAPAPAAPGSDEAVSESFETPPPGEGPAGGPGDDPGPRPTLKRIK
ncbi:ClpXP protease specificity-enhancing factor [Mitsuaria sp. WAJ17]|uniref:ClpXP protease specificity-enhancing factor n=1 Tax=Mitsuaria sp. WAJ17 TaxID=2761452 RepID=UPI0016010B27|nr:ClpXP protease specificity-enhancing factor [Mitsuaria sp. WAJ17]MBB2484637.1 ClpXP protease specificity-enhancing factor [Mitsuaria sp. WAJ17]